MKTTIPQRAAPAAPVQAADQRVAGAREYLDGARHRKVTELPPSVLVRELAETRRQLGIVLAPGWQLPAQPRPATPGTGRRVPHG